MVTLQLLSNFMEIVRTASEFFFHLFVLRSGNIPPAIQIQKFYSQDYQLQELEVLLSPFQCWLFAVLSILPTVLLKSFPLPFILFFLALQHIALPLRRVQYCQITLTYTYTNTEENSRCALPEPWHPPVGKQDCATFQCSNNQALSQHFRRESHDSSTANIHETSM